MTQKRILELARSAALEIWDYEHKLLKEMPDNEAAQTRERIAWTELKEIEAESKKLENEEN